MKNKFDKIRLVEHYKEFLESVDEEFKKETGDKFTDKKFMSILESLLADFEDKEKLVNLFCNADNLLTMIEFMSLVNLYAKDKEMSNLYGNILKSFVDKDGIDEIGNIKVYFIEIDNEDEDDE